MRFKYRKLIITASCSAMLLGMVIFSTKNSLDMRAASTPDATSVKTTSVVTDNSTSTVKDEKATSELQTTVDTASEDAVKSTDNAKGVSILMKNAYPEVNKLISEYYKARLKVDKDKIGKLVDNVYYAGIEELPQMMKNFEDIKLVDCYTIDGPEDKATMVYASTETKIKGIDTPASGVDGFYVKPDANGDLKIILSPVTNEVQKIIDEDTKREDVVALLSDVNTKLAHEIKSDKKLSDFFDKLKNRQAGSDENIEISESKDNKDKKSDKAIVSKKSKKKSSKKKKNK